MQSGLKGSEVYLSFLFAIGRERRGQVGTGKLSLVFPPRNAFCSWVEGAAFRASCRGSLQIISWPSSSPAAAAGVGLLPLDVRDAVGTAPAWASPGPVQLQCHLGLWEEGAFTRGCSLLKTHPFFSIEDLLPPAPQYTEGNGNITPAAF